MDNIDQLWEDTGGSYLLRGHAHFQDYFDSLLWSDRAFKLSDRAMRCMDEGTTGGKRRAGSGILDDDIENDSRGKVAGYYSHEGCATAVLYARKFGIRTNDPEGMAEKRIQEIAKKQSVPFLGRIALDQLKRPAERHIARALYYCWVDFDPSQVPGLAPGFVLSRDTVSDPEQAILEGKIAISIALDETLGFGPRFSSDDPFHLVAVVPANNPELRATLLDELARIADGKPAIRVDTITARR